MNLIENIPVDLEAPELVKSLRIRRNVSYMTDKLALLVETIKPVMNPKALYTVQYINGIEGDRVKIGENVFTSKVLRINFEPIGRVFPYLVTAGTELDDIVLPEGQSAMLLGLVKTVVVSRAFKYLQAHLEEKYRVPKMSSISPGRLDEWPIVQQRELFRIFGDDIDRIGVHLTKTCLMIPVKTVSGFLFPSEEGFDSCQLCQRNKCMGRRAAFNPSLAEQFGVVNQ